MFGYKKKQSLLVSFSQLFNPVKLRKLNAEFVCKVIRNVVHIVTAATYGLSSVFDFGEMILKDVLAKIIDCVNRFRKLSFFIF